MVSPPDLRRNYLAYGLKSAHAFVLALLWITDPAAAAGADQFEARCARLALRANISVVFEDRAVSRDDSRTLAELRGLASEGADAWHSVLGLTHVVPAARMEILPHLLEGDDGQVCAVPSVRLILGFSELEVLLARELQDPCRRRIVAEHEDEHVAIWRGHFRVGARLLQPVLKDLLVKPMYFDDADQARDELPRRVNELVTPFLEHLKEGARKANQTLDSPTSYQFEEGRMRSCP